MRGFCSQANALAGPDCKLSPAAVQQQRASLCSSLQPALQAFHVASLHSAAKQLEAAEFLTTQQHMPADHLHPSVAGQL